MVIGVVASRCPDRGSTASGFVVGAALVLAAGVALDAYVLRPDVPVPQATATPSPTAGPTSSPSASPEPPPSFADAYEQVSSGVVRIGNTGCGSGGMGSGALVADDLVATSAHVVHRYATLQLILGDQVASGEVVDHDAAADLALVRASQPLTGHVFSVVDSLPGVGSEVAAVGYPLDGPLSLAGPGIVSAYGEQATYDMGDGERIEATDLMRVSVPTNPGNSGGPVIDERGRLVGLVSGSRERMLDDQGNVVVEDVDGIRLATTASQVSEALTELGDSPLAAEQCEQAPVDEGAELVTTSLEATEATEAVRDVLFDYFDGINTSDYERAYRQLSDVRRARLSPERFREEQSTSIVSDVVLLDVTETGGELRATVTFTSTQAPAFGPDGLECAYWTLEYRLVPGGEHGWQITASGETAAAPRFQACS